MDNKMLNVGSGRKVQGLGENVVEKTLNPEP
jgi:hypothetical protein